MVSIDLKLIKKHYGEKMMHLCRELFPTILERNGLLFKLLSDNFDYSRFLCEDILNNTMEEEFKDYIYSKIDVENNCVEIVKKSPQELLDEKGYILYECHSEDDIQSFKKYYAPGEELCTFRGGRLRRCYVFFAVKKNVDEIRREDFSYPEREDLYGTSVMSIQFTRDSSNTVSIKNRYNHTVNNPDSTYSNNLDIINSGLTAAFNNTYHLNINSKNSYGFELDNYVLASDGKYYKYNYEIDNTYYCPNNIVIKDFIVNKYEKEKYIVFDNFILDLVNKKIYSNENDSFIDSIGEIEDVNVTIDKEKLVKKIVINKNIIITLDKYNRMIDYYNPVVRRIDDGFLLNNRTIQSISLPNVEEIGNYFLPDAVELVNLDLENVKKIKNNFMTCCRNLETLYLPNVEEIGHSFILNGGQLKNVLLPKLKKVGNYCFFGCDNISEINLASVEEIGDNFAANCKNLESVNFPAVKKVGYYFLNNCINLKSFAMPSVEEIANYFCSNNTSCKTVNLPNVKVIGDKFFYMNEIIDSINLGNVEKIGNYFLGLNQSIKSIELSKVKEIGDYFLYKNLSAESVKLSKVRKIGDNFCPENVNLNSIEIPLVEEIGDNFLFKDKGLKSIILSYVKKIGDYFLFTNNDLESISMPEVRIIGNNCLSCNSRLENISLLNVESIGKDFLRFCKSIRMIIAPKMKKIGENFCSSSEYINVDEFSMNNELGGRRL